MSVAKVRRGLGQTKQSDSILDKPATAQHTLRMLAYFT
jgi:hypothetical protein